MKGEKGQALPLAILALTIGMLLVAPFLGHASSSIIGSRTYGEAITYRNVADAGIEHGIWNLRYHGLGDLIPNPGDAITYNLPESINGVTATITVTTNATAKTIGKITKTAIDTLDFDTSSGYTPNMVQVTGSIYAIAYRGTSNRGYLKTVSIDVNGDIGNSVISTLVFDSSSGYEADIIQVTSNIYAIAYRGASNRGYLKTVSITSGGVIGGSVISTLTFDSTACYGPSIIQVASNIFAIAYRGSSNRGYLKTVSITSGGVIGGSVISSLTFDNSTCYEPDIIHVSGNYYAIAYRGASTRGYLETVSITAAGIIGGSVISTLIFDTTASYEPSIVQVTGNIFAIAYRKTSNGSLKTVSIGANGIIGSSVISTLVFDGAASNMPDIITVAGNTSVIAYGNSTNKGYLKTVAIAANGIIGAAAVDTFNFDTSACYEPSMLYVTGDIFAIAYRGPSNHGYLKTIGITTSAGFNAYRIVSTAGSTTIKAYVSTNRTAATIISWQIK